MSKLIAVVEAPKNFAMVEGLRNPYPIVIYIPNAGQDPRAWVEREVLPKHQGSIVRMYKAGPVFEPATHMMLKPYGADGWNG